MTNYVLKASDLIRVISHNKMFLFTILLPSFPPKLCPVVSTWFCHLPLNLHRNVHKFLNSVILVNQLFYVLFLHLCLVIYLSKTVISTSVSVYVSEIYVSHFSGPGTSVVIATVLLAGRSGDLIPVGVRFSAPVQTGPGAHPASCTIGIGSFQGVNCGRAVLLNTHPLLVSSGPHQACKGVTLPLPFT
jgi:hypothetical protein